MPLGESLSQFPESESLESRWYLRILSSASYYTTDKERMRHPDSVPVELGMSTLEAFRIDFHLLTSISVLDPYILNLLPQSLLHIAGVVVSVVFIAWWASTKIYKWLSIGNQINAKKMN